MVVGEDRLGFSWQFPDSGCGGKAVILMAVSDAGFGGSVRVSHGSFTRLLLWERRDFSWQSQTLVVGGGEALVLITVPYAGCWGREVGVLMPVPEAGCGWEKRVFSLQSQAQVLLGWRGGSSHGSPRCCLWGESYWF